MKEMAIIVFLLLVGRPCCGETNLMGNWCCIETNRYGASAPRHADETYVTTTRFCFTANGTVTVTATTPFNIQRPLIINTKHVGAYAIEENRLTIVAREVTGYRARMRPLDDSYLFAQDGAVLVLTNRANGEVRCLTHEQQTEPQGGGYSPPAARSAQPTP